MTSNSDPHGAHEIELTFDGVDGFKIVLAKTEHGQVAFYDIGMADAVAQRNLCVDLAGRISVALYRLANKSQAPVTDDIGIRLFNLEALHHSLTG